MFVILNDACKDGKHALVSLSSIKDGQFHDPTCLIEAGSHEFVKVRSFVRYQMARIDLAAHLTKCVDGWTFAAKDPMPAEIVCQMLAGALVSEFTPIFVQEYIQSL